MEIDRKELKRQARERMREVSPPFWAVTLLYLLLTQGVSLAADCLSSFLESPAAGEISTTALFLSLLVTLYSTVVTFGLRLWSLWTWRRLDPGPGSLLQGFSVVGRVLWMEVLIFLRLLPWCFLFSFGASILILLLIPAEAFIPTLSLAIFLFMTVGLWLIMLRYALAPYLLADRPDDGAGPAVQRSVGLMRGWTWELLKLELSFLGWELINAFLSSLVIVFFLSRGGVFQTGLSPEQLLSLIQSILYDPTVQFFSALVTLPLTLWLTPYREVARAGFYDARLKLHQEKLPEMPPL